MKQEAAHKETEKEEKINPDRCKGVGEILRPFFSSAWPVVDML